MTRTIRLFGGALLCAAAAWSAMAQVPQSTMLGEATISVNERAKAAGYLRVRVQPSGGTAVEATVPINDGMSENEIAASLTAALGAVVGANYKIDRDGGEKVKIRKATKEVADFTVELAFSAPGVGLVIEN